MSVVFLDFETRSVVDIKKSGAEVYARHPSTQVLCLGYAVDDGPVELWIPGEELPYFPHTVTLVAHNAAFEIEIWNHVMTRDYCVGEISPERWECTQAMAYAMALPGALADAAPAAGLTHNKDSAGHRVMLQLSQPRDILDDGTVVWWEPAQVPEKFEKLYSYCRQDVEVERELYARLMKFSPREKALWILDRKINDRGVKVDLKAAKAALRMVDIEKKRFNEEIKELTGGAVVTTTATGQLLSWLKQNGVEADGVAKSDVVALLSLPTLPPACRRALLLRQESAKSSTAKLEAMLKGVCEDGRLRGMFQYHGAGATGRFAGRRVQLQNLPRPRLSQSDIDEVFAILEAVQ